jgi:hypothetical protein
MGIIITRERDQYGTELTGTCVCGAEVSQYVERGAAVSMVPGPFPTDIECEDCGRWYNASGQEINVRVDSWEEPWDEE